MHTCVFHRTVLPGVDAVSIRSDRTFPRHSHDEFGFGFIVNGAQDSWSGLGLVEAEAGDTITVNPAELHDGVGRKGQPREWQMLYLSPAEMETYCEVPVESIEFSHPVNKSRHALRLTVDAFAAVTADQPDADYAEQLVMLAIDAQFEPKTAVGTANSSARSSEVQTVLDMICQNWALPLTLADFAQATDTSRYQILRWFLQDIGATPHAYLTQHRVKRAKDMIVKGSSLADTAHACGFSDQSHMTRAFSRQFGLTPGRFVSKTA